MPVPPADWVAVVQRHLAAHPSMTAQDLCKLVHQGVLGPGHAIADATAARDRLAREAATMGVGPLPPIVEPIAPGGALVRVHLRPYVAAGLTLDRLATAFVASAALPAGDGAALALAVRAVSAALVRHAPGRVAAWHAELTRWQELGMPAVHHSASYVLAERPAYRVVTGTLAASLVS